MRWDGLTWREVRWYMLSGGVSISVGRQEAVTHTLGRRNVRDQEVQRVDICSGLAEIQHNRSSEPTSSATYENQIEHADDAGTDETKSEVLYVSSSVYVYSTE